MAVSEKSDASAPIKKKSAPKKTAGASLRPSRPLSRKKADKEPAKKVFRPASSVQMQNDGMLNMAVKAARKAGKIQMMAVRDRENLKISQKGIGDFVTEVDKECERAILEILMTAYPDHAFLGEEGGKIGNPASEYLWVIDPLDGTTNFIHRIPQFCVSIALLKDGAPLHAVVYDPNANELFTATKGKGAFRTGERIRVSGRSSIAEALLGTGFPFREGDDYDKYVDVMKEMMRVTAGLRRPGSAALDLCWVACGRFDGFWEKGIKIWDIAAGALIAREAGALVTDYNGEGKFLEKEEIIAATPKIFPPMYAVINPESREKDKENRKP